VSDGDAPRTSVRRVLRIWAPTALGSSVLMVEIPVILALAARGPRGAASLAGLGVALSLILLVNSPALALASTTATLSRGAAAVARLRTLALLAGSIPAALLVTALLTPAADWLFRSVIHVPSNAVGLTRVALWLLAPAPLVVAWRRYQHGLLIACGATGPIAWASFARIGISIAVASFALAATGVSGAALGAVALTAGATGEALVVTVLARRTGAWEAARQRPGDDPPLARLIRFHLPLAATMALSMVPQPLVTAGIARGRHPEISLAAWPVLYGLVWVLAGSTAEMESITASKHGGPGGRHATRTFATLLGSALALVLLLVLATPLARLYFVDVSGVHGAAAEAGTRAARVAVVLPLLYALRAWLRGALIARRRTTAVQWAMGASIVVLVPVLAGGVAFTSLDGVTIGAAALVVALAAELSVLTVFDGGVARRLARGRAALPSGAAALDVRDGPL
jgi:Na+-driven multidrug efflux pump